MLSDGHFKEMTGSEKQRISCYDKEGKPLRSPQAPSPGKRESPKDSGTIVTRRRRPPWATTGQEEEAIIQLICRQRAGQDHGQIQEEPAKSLLAEEMYVHAQTQTSQSLFGAHGRQLQVQETTL